MRTLIIVGAGGFGREVCDWAQQCPGYGEEWEIGGFLDDNPDALSGFEGMPFGVIGSPSSYEPKPDEVLTVAVGTPSIKRRLTTMLEERGAQFASIIHPTVVLGRNVQLGRGVILCPYTVLTCDIFIDDFVSMNLHCSVGHDARIGAWSQLSSHCDITGGVQLGEEVFLGSHASVLPRCRIGDRAVIGAGAVACSNIPAGKTVVGVPARLLKAL